MRLKHSSEFVIDGDELSYDEFIQVADAVTKAGRDATVTITQTKYDDGPYGTSTTTRIDVEVA